MGVAEINSRILFNPKKMDASSTPVILFSSLLPKKIEFYEIKHASGQRRVQSDYLGNLRDKTILRVKQVIKGFINTFQ